MLLTIRIGLPVNRSGDVFCIPLQTDIIILPFHILSGSGPPGNSGINKQNFSYTDIIS